MADLAIATRHDHAQPVPFFTTRVHALLRLIGRRRRRATLTAKLDFADAHVQADVGVRANRHRDDWLNAFLAR